MRRYQIVFLIRGLNEILILVLVELDKAPFAVDEVACHARIERGGLTSRLLSLIAMRPMKGLVRTRWLQVVLATCRWNNFPLLA